MHTPNRILKYPLLSLMPTALFFWTTPSPVLGVGYDTPGLHASAGVMNGGAQKPPKKKEIRFLVKGNCGQCEQRILEALDQRGIIAAGWDRNQQEAWVVFKPSLVSEEQIHDYIAAAGHDTALKKANSEVYKRLPQCCLYRDGLNVHDD